MYNKQRYFTFREEPISMQDNGLNDCDHMDRRSCCHLGQCPEPQLRGQSVSLIQMSFMLHSGARCTRFLPLCLCPEQVGSQDYGDVAGSHFINLAVLSQLGKKLYQIPATQIVILKFPRQYRFITRPFETLAPKQIQLH